MCFVAPICAPHNGRAVVSYRESLDAICEREALAILRLSRRTGNPVPSDPRVRLAREVETAARLGIPAPRRMVYRRGPDRFDQIARGQSRNRPCRLSDTWEDRQRRVRARQSAMDAVARLQILARQQADTEIRVADAVKLIPLSERTLHRARQQGAITALKDRSGRAVVRVQELAEFLAAWVSEGRTFRTITAA